EPACVAILHDPDGIAAVVEPQSEPHLRVPVELTIRCRRRRVPCGNRLLHRHQLRPGLVHLRRTSVKSRSAPEAGAMFRDAWSRSVGLAEVPEIQGSRTVAHPVREAISLCWLS